MTADRTTDARPPEPQGSVEERVELVEERAVIDKRTVERVGARIQLRTVEEEVPFTETLRRERVEIERTPRDLVVDEPPATRTEGATMIVPIVEEVLVKRYRIIEEVHVTSIAEEVEVSDSVTLRRQEAFVDENPDPAAVAD